MVLSVYDMLNTAWKSTSKVLFGQELGELKEFESYLKPAAIGQTVKSSFSGKEMWVTSSNYSKKAKYSDYSNELDKFAKSSSKPFEINEIKDIDSIVLALKERFIYGGNKVFGNSKFVEHSDAVQDSTAVLNCSKLISSKYIAYSYLLQNSEYIFGSTSNGQSSHIIRCLYNNSIRRCFEVSTSVGASDSYFSYNVFQCTNCMFSFNLRSKNNMIGNIQLGSTKYHELKSRLVSEIADTLKSKKRMGFSVIDLMNNA